MPFNGSNPQKDFAMRRHPSRGFTLLELLLTLGVIGVLATLTMVGVHIYNTRQDGVVAVQDTRALATSLSRSYGQTGSFAGLDSSAIAKGGLDHGTLRVAGATLSNRWGGTVDVAAAEANRSYAITWTKVPTAACVSMATGLQQDFPGLSINGTVLSSADDAGTANGTTPAVSRVASLCQTPANTVVLTARPVFLASTGELAAPADHGATAPVVPAGPSGMDVTTVGEISDVAPTSPFFAVNPAGSAIPPASGVAPVSGVGSAVGTPGAPPVILPGTALPPQTCFAGVTRSGATDTPESQFRTAACPAGMTGSIAQQSTRMRSDVTVRQTLCANPWAAPQYKDSVDTTWTDWSGWADVTNSCVTPPNGNPAGNPDPAVAPDVPTVDYEQFYEGGTYAFSATISWQKVPGAAYYNLELPICGSFSSTGCGLITANHLLNSPYFTHSNQGAGGGNRKAPFGDTVRVQACNAAGVCSGWGEAAWHMTCIVQHDDNSFPYHNCPKTPGADPGDF